MADERHQGWTNYETWAVGLWINQDEPMYRYLKLLAHSPQLNIEKDRALREWVEGMNTLTDGSMFSDLLGRESISSSSGRYQRSQSSGCRRSGPSGFTSARHAWSQTMY